MSTDPASPIRLAVIVGSNREGRFAPTVSRWFAGQLDRRTDVETDVIDLDDVEIPLRFGAAGRSAMTPFRERIGAADAIVVITPEYNHSYPAPLKQAIDFVKLEWFAKPIGFVAYGGVSGGLRAVEHLRNVFAELHAVTIRDSVSLHGAGGRFNEAGQLLEPEPADAAAQLMLDELVWFAEALRAARAARPYTSLLPS